MRQQTEQDIFRYIEFLRDEGYVVALSSLNKTLLRESVPNLLGHDIIEKNLPVLLNYEHHLCDICIRLKSQKKTRAKCIQYKALLEHADTREILYDSCWAGVEDYVFPIICQDQLVCRVHISGYYGTTPKSVRRAKVVVNKWGKEYAELYARLSTKVPSRQYLERLINPFVYMFDKLCQENLSVDSKVDRTMHIYLKAIRYINGHFMEDISSESIAQAVNYSPSYLRSVFAKISGKSMVEYVNLIRLVHGAELLRFTRLSVTEIAYECGFRDGNYFSTAFKKFYGLPPLAFRNKRDQSI